jgi:hypothetical protein
MSLQTAGLLQGKRRRAQVSVLWAMVSGHTTCLRGHTDGALKTQSVGPSRVDPRRVGAPDSPTIWRPCKYTFVKRFRSVTGLANILRARDQISGNFRINSLAYENLNLLAPYFRLFQVCLIATDRFVPQGAAARLFRPPTSVLGPSET